MRHALNTKKANSDRISYKISSILNEKLKFSLHYMDIIENHLRAVKEIPRRSAAILRGDEKCACSIFISSTTIRGFKLSYGSSSFILVTIFRAVWGARIVYSDREPSVLQPRRPSSLLCTFLRVEQEVSGSCLKRFFFYFFLSLLFIRMFVLYIPDAADGFRLGDGSTVTVHQLIFQPRTAIFHILQIGNDSKTV